MFTAINSREIVWNASPTAKTLQQVSETKEIVSDKLDAAITRIAITHSPEDDSGDGSLEYVKSLVMWKPVKLTSKQVLNIQIKLVELMNAAPKSYTESIEEILKAHQVSEAQCKMHTLLYSQIQNIRALDAKSVSGIVQTKTENRM